MKDSEEQDRDDFYHQLGTEMQKQEQTLVERLRTRAQIRRGITTRKSVQNGEPDRIADLLEEAARYIHDLESVSDLQLAFYERLKAKYNEAVNEITDLTCDNDYMRTVIIDLQNSVGQS